MLPLGLGWGTPAASAAFDDALSVSQERSMLSSSISSSCDARISAMLGALGSCSRIKHTPMPFAYIVHLRCATP